MRRNMLRAVPFFAAAAALLLLQPNAARAQLNGSHSLGDFGVLSGTQPAPHFYGALFYYKYDSDVIRNADGDQVTLAPESPGSIGMHALAPLLWYVTDVKILGANYGVMAVIPFANASLEAPAFGFDGEISTKLADILLRPIDLGWHGDRWDATAGFQVYLPTGKYEPGGSDNIGKGMWTYEPFAGGTLYFDEGKTWSLSTTAYLELHSSKKDSETKVGDILSLQGGLGKSFLGGGLIVGATYYTQWKLSEDDLGEIELPGGVVDVEIENKHRVFGIGPDVTLPIATKKTLYGLLNIRYIWETSARMKTEGQTLTVTLTAPIPFVDLQ